MKMNQLLVCAILGLPLAACEHKSAPNAPAAAATAVPSAPSMVVGDDPAVPKLAIGTSAKCAVSGEEFKVTASTAQVTYNGKRYAFCCPDCQPAFAKNPAKYAKN
ncbi:MAG TPA: YHS domain-containing protein [Polyangia bacterium]|jgi:YHS domain-containing protein